MSKLSSAPRTPAQDTEPDEVLLSCLIDGELDGEQRDRVLQQLMRDDKTQRLWADMHVVGDALRSHEVACLHQAQFHARLQVRLAEEPHILAPLWRRERVLQRFIAPGVAVAAAVAVLAVMVLPQLRGGQAGNGSDVGLNAGMALPSAAPERAEGGVVATSNALPMHRYLQAHREFVPTGGVLPPSAPYLRTSAAVEPRREP